MRGSPLTGRPGRVVIGTLLMPMVLACGSVGLGANGTSATAGLTISSAAGETTAFEPARATVNADGPITVTFQNGSGLPHNLTFTGTLTAATRTIVDPGASEELRLAPLAPGSYPFVCTIHDGMAGTLLVESAVP